MKGFGLVVISLSVLLCSAAYTIEWAGNQVIYLDAEDLALGAVTSWTNKVGVGGNFTVAAGSAGTPQAAEITEGSSGVPKKMVVFNAADFNRGTATALVWANTGPAGICSNNPFTVEAWIHNDVANAYEGFFSFRERGNPGESNFAHFYCGYGLGAPESRAVADVGAWWPEWPTAPEPGVFHLFTFTFDGTDVKLYRDGVLQLTYNGSTWNITPGGAVYVGACGRLGGPPNFQYGLSAGIAKLRVHEGALTLEQVAANYAEESPDYITAPVSAEVSSNGPIGFGELNPGRTYGPKTLIIENSGVLDLTLNGVGEGISITGPNSAEFSMDPDPADTATLPIGATRAIDIYCTPSNNEPKIAFLTIASDALAESPALIPLAASYTTVYVNASTGTDDYAVGRGLSPEDPYASIGFALNTTPTNVYVAAGTYGKFDLLGGMDVTIAAEEVGTVTVALGAGETINVGSSGTIKFVVDGINFEKTDGGEAVITTIGEGPKDATFDRCDVTTSAGGRGINVTTGNLTLNVLRTTIHDCLDGGVRTGNFNDCAYNFSQTSFINNGARLEFCGGRQGGVVGSGNSSLTMDRCFVSAGNQSLLLWIYGDEPAVVTNSVFETGTNRWGGKELCIDLWDVPNTSRFDNLTIISTGTNTETIVGIESRGGFVRNCIVLGFNVPAGSVDIGAGAQQTTNLITSGNTDNLFAGQVGAWVRPVAPTEDPTSYRLQTGSPAVGTGTDIDLTVDYDGMSWKTPPSKGAFEFDSAPPATPTPEAPTPTPKPPTTGIENWSLFE